MIELLSRKAPQELTPDDAAIMLGIDWVLVCQYFTGDRIDAEVMFYLSDSNREETATKV